MDWYVYMLECADGTLYTGVTPGVAARVAAHNGGKGARYTRGRRPVALAYLERAGSRSAALRREYAIKRLGAEAKRRLVVQAGRADALSCG